MSNLLPLATFNLALDPFNPQPCQADEFPITVRITLAAIDPEAVDDKEEPSTLRLLKKSELSADDDDYFDMGSSDEDSEEEDSEESEEEEKPTKKASKKASKEDSEEEDSDEEDSDEEDAEDAVEEHVICTLSPKTQYQQTLDFTITPEEEVFFVVTGSYRVHLTGNYVDHPNDEDEDDYIYGDDSEDDSEGDYDLTPDEDEILSEVEYDLEELEDVEDLEGKIEELVQEDNQKKRKSTDASEKESKKSKKEKTVKFNKELEQGPTPTKKAEVVAKKAEKKETKKVEAEAPAKKEAPKPKAKTIAGGVVIEDKSSGSGPVAKKGQKVGVRYIGKLKNGKVFDKNTSGKPFLFSLGKGEVIKGWDVGVAGMAVGGERRIVIPAPMAYGKSKIPGIPPNSELTFDVKLLSIK